MDNTNTLNNLLQTQYEIDTILKRQYYIHERIFGVIGSGDVDTADSYQTELEVIKSNIQTLYARFNKQYADLQPYIIDKLPKYV